MVTLCKVQLCLLIGCAVLWMDIADGKSVPAKDLETAASNKKSNKKYFSNGDGTENDNGYSKSSEDKGTGGYDKYETFHKDDGDSYAYEKHEGHGNNKKDDDKDHDFEDSYKYSHSSGSKHGDNDEQQNEEYSSGGNSESGEDGYGGSESYRRSYKSGESESGESVEEDSDNGESRNNGQIIYGTHPGGKNVVKQPTGPSDAATHHQYMVFEPTHADQPKKSMKKVSIATQSPSQRYKKVDRSYEGHDMDPVRGYSSYVVHMTPKGNGVGKAISSSLVNVGTSIQVAGNENYNQAQQPHGLSGYPMQKPGKKIVHHRPSYSDSSDSEEDSSDEDHDDHQSAHSKAKQQFVYASEADKDAYY